MSLGFAIIVTGIIQILPFFKQSTIATVIVAASTFIVAFVVYFLFFRIELNHEVVEPEHPFFGQKCSENN